MTRHSALVPQTPCASMLKVRKQRTARKGHEATDSELAYPPVSQPYGHRYNSLLRKGGGVLHHQPDTQIMLPPPLCISYANVHNYYGPYAYCSLDQGVACAQHIQPPTHTCAGHMCCNWQFSTYGLHQTKKKKNSLCTSRGAHVLKLANVTTNPCLMWPHYISCITKLRTKLLRSLRLL